jgi:hydroxymethylpyrimidine/phosphomethylpyrimidine kinase
MSHLTIGAMQNGETSDMSEKNVPVALTVAGSDSGGGAGIQADLKTFTSCGTFGTSVLTAITAQNLEGVTAVQAVEPGIVEAQLQAIFDGFPVRAAKTGMLFSVETIATVAGFFESRRGIPLVVDPVFAATSGARLIRNEAIEVMRNRLFPLAALITPNMPEAEHLLGGKPIRSGADLHEAAFALFERFGVPVLMKGGHLLSRADDIFVDGGGKTLLEGEFIEGVNTHGSGCTYSAAIAANLARGMHLLEAVAQAKNYMRRSLLDPLEIKRKTRLINHFWAYN